MGTKKCRIDRAIVNHVWQDYFPVYGVVFAAPGIGSLPYYFYSA